MNIIMECNDFLVLRDGHPFGEIGVVDGYSRVWPLPQTITGMLRSKIGLTKDKNYFDNEENRRKIFDYGINQQIPMLEDGRFLAPVPADIIFSTQDNGLIPNIPQLRKIDSSNGTDIKNRDWLIPYLDLKDKPAKEKPFFLYWDIFMKYLEEDLEGNEYSLYEQGCSSPITNYRMHNAINSETMTTGNGQLFSNVGIYFMVKVDNGKKEKVKLMIDVFGDLSDVDLSGDAYLGGERKTVNLQHTEKKFPVCPKIFENKKYLKLILSTHGDFGSWCPNWLMPDLDKDEIEWTTIPNTNYEIRLRTAYINGHDVISGWDYVTKKPKASKKVVLPGAVYIIELENSNDSQAVAEYFWGSSMDFNNKESSLNGYNQVFVGNAEKNVIE